MVRKSLSVKERKEFGSAASRRSRRAGLIPAVVYGHNESRHFLVNKREFNASFRHISESEIITLKLDEGEIQVLIKDYQFNILRDELHHLDFYEIEMGKVLRTHVPIVLQGTPIGVREGGILEAPLHELDIECLPKDLPEKITVDISNVQGSSALHVSDLTPPENVKILTHSDQVVVAVTHVRAEIEETEEAVEDEVLGAEE